MFRKIKYRIMVLNELKPYAYSVKKFFLLNFLISTFLLVLSFINPLFYKIFIEDVILKKHFSQIIFVLVGYLSVFITTILLGYLRNYSTNRLVNRTVFRAKHKIWSSFWKLDFSEYENLNIGDLKMRVEDDTVQIKAFSGTQSIDYLTSVTTILVCLFLLFIIDVRLAIFSIVAIPLTFWIDNIISKKEKILNDSNRENDQKMSTWLLTSVQGWREIKAFNLQKHQEIRFVKFLHTYALYFGSWINYWVVRVLIIPKIKEQFLMQFGLYFLGGLLIIKGNLKISELLVFAMYYDMLSNAIRTGSFADAELQSAMPLTNRMLEELKKNENKVCMQKSILDQIDTISFYNVDFRYVKSESNILNQLNFTINKGERVAITGKSGCGKTTILKLLVGMLYSTSGVVLYSGIDIKKFDVESIHKKIGFVMQENILFNASIKKNLLYGNAHATIIEIENACKKACINDFIEQLPNKFETVIGERGIKLSGGQRQRIILARLFLSEVEVFIFDEATSALDQYSESIIHDAIRSISRDKTIIVVAHRESSISLCDKRIEL